VAVQQCNNMLINIGVARILSRGALFFPEKGDDLSWSSPSKRTLKLPK